MRWLWWLLGLGVVGGGVYYLVSSSTGRPVPAKTACVADLPTDFKAQVQAAIASRDAVRLASLATQADAQSWTCAATEIRAEILKAKAASAGIADVSDPPRGDWQKLLDRSLSEADPGGDLIASLEAAATDATTRGYAKVHDLLHDAARDVRRSIRLARITEEPPAKAAQAAIAAAVDPKYAPTRATVDGLRALATQLDGLGYAGAAGEARSMADAAQKIVSTPSIVFAPGPSTSVSTDPLLSLPADVRAAVDAAYASGDPQQLDDVAAASLVGYPEAWKKVKDDAVAIRARWYVAFLDLPTGKGSVFAEIASSGDAVFPGSAPSMWGASEEWDVIRPIADALWKRGYRTAANQLARQWGTLKAKRVDYPVDLGFAWAFYPLPPAI